MPAPVQLHDAAHGDDGHPDCFSDHYCRRHGIYREGFMLAVLQRTLPPHFRPWFSVVLTFAPGYFTPDFGFIVAVGRGEVYADFDLAAREFAAHPANRGFLRRQLRLRVSTRRMRRLLREIYVQKFRVLPSAEETESFPPFPARRETLPSAHSLTTAQAPHPYAQR